MFGALELEACQFKMEPEPALNVALENVVEQELLVLLAREGAASHQVDKGVATDIKFPCCH